MKIDVGWGLVILLLVAFVVWRLSALAGRIDRLHHRIELARASLDAQLLRRARAAEALATSGLLDPASAIVLAQAASRSRNADPATPWSAGIVESELSRDLREVFADQRGGRRAACRSPRARSCSWTWPPPAAR